MGRNMFGPIRGDWVTAVWRGWWGEDPPYHHPVFVLTHHPPRPIPMAGGTTFFFVTDGIEAAVRARLRRGGRARRPARWRRLDLQAYLRAGLVDELHVPVVPILLGGGERLFEDLGALPGYETTELVCSRSAAHVVLTRTASA